MIPIPGFDLEVKVTDLEFLYKSKKNLHLSLYSYIIKTFYFVILLLIGFGDIAISMESIHPSIHLSVHKCIIVHPITPNYPLSYFHETLSDCRGHLVGVSGTRMTTLTDLVHELSPLVTKNCQNFVRTVTLKHFKILS